MKQIEFEDDNIDSYNTYSDCVEIYMKDEKHVRPHICISITKDELAYLIKQINRENCKGKK